MDARLRADRFLRPGKYQQHAFLPAGTRFTKRLWNKEEVGIYAACGLARRTQGICAKKGELEDLGLLWAAESSPWTRYRIQEARARMKRGDLAFISLHSNSGHCVFWLGKGKRVDGGEWSVDVEDSQEDAWVLYETWKSAGASLDPVPAEVLADLAGQVDGTLWVCCPYGNSSQRWAILEAGFQQRYALRHRSVLGRLRRTSLDWIERAPLGEGAKTEVAIRA